MARMVNWSFPSDRFDHTVTSVPEPSTLTLFAVSALALVAVPGPNLIYIVTRSVDQGRGAGVASALGVETATLVHIAAAAAGLSAALASSATAFTVVKYAGAAYLVFLALRAFRERDDDRQAGRAPAAGRRVFAEGFVVNLLNPKVAHSSSRSCRSSSIRAPAPRGLRSSCLVGCSPRSGSAWT